MPPGGAKEHLKVAKMAIFAIVLQIGRLEMDQLFDQDSIEHHHTKRGPKSKNPKIVKIGQKMAIFKKWSPFKL